MHTAKVIPESVKQVGTRGICFVTRCCDDPATDEPHHIQEATGMSADDLNYAMEQYATRHAEEHRAGTDAVRLAKVVASISQPKGDCGCSGGNS